MKRLVVGLCALAVLALAGFLGVAPAVAAPAWHLQQPGSNHLFGVDFVDPSHGWAVGKSGEIIATSDGGRTWASQTSGTTEDLEGVSFVDRQHGWIVGEGGTILATSDGGEHWAAQTSGTTEILYGVRFNDATHGWAAGSGHVLLKTTDGGSTWAPMGSPTSGTFLGVAFADSTHGIVFGSVGLRGTADGGSTWTDKGASSTIADGTFVGTTHGWAVGVGGEILATSDGSSWAPQSSGTSAQLNSVSFADVEHGWAVGNGGVILDTTDGTLWWGQSSGTSNDLWGVSAPSSSYAYAVGTFGIVDSYYDAAAASAFEVTAPANAKVGEPVSFTVTALTSAGQVASEFSGSVHFTSSDGSAVLPGDATLTNGTGTFSATLNSAGNRTITATSGAATGTSGSIAVAKATPTISTTPSTSVAVGGSVSDEATVSGRVNPQEGATITFDLFAPADTTCTGTPVFTITNSYSAAATSISSGSFTPTAPGVYRWTAEYSGDANNAPAGTACGYSEQSVIIAKAASATALVATPNPAASGAKVTLTATVTGYKPSGTVTFKEGSAVLGSATLDSAGHATLEVAGLAPGSHSLSVAYAGDASNLASASPTVTEVVEAPPAPSAPSVVVTYSPNVPHTPNPKGGPRYTFHFSDPVGGASFLCRLDGGGWHPCTSPTVYRSLKPGHHVFRVKSVDAAGNESAVETVKFVAGRHR